MVKTIFEEMGGTYVRQGRFIFLAAVSAFFGRQSHDLLI